MTPQAIPPRRAAVLAPTDPLWDVWCPTRDQTREHAIRVQAPTDAAAIAGAWARAWVSEDPPARAVVLQGGVELHAMPVDGAEALVLELEAVPRLELFVRVKGTRAQEPGT